MIPAIVYRQDNGAVAFVRPSEEALGLYGIDAIARKDVPVGKPYRIVDAAELPADQAERETWEIGDDELIDGIGADYGAGTDWEVVCMSPLVVRHRETGETKQAAP